MKIKWFKPLLWYLLVFSVALISFFPILWIFLTSIKPPAEIYAWPPIYVPYHPTLQNYIEVFRTPLLRYILNSIIVSGSATLITLALGSLASYSFARGQWRGRTASMLGLLAFSMFPPMTIVPALFLFFRKIGLLNTYQGLILTHSALYLPLVIWVLTNYFKTIPIELEDAARVDGCSTLRLIWNVILPVARPGLLAAGLIGFIMSWMEFPMSLVLLTKNELRTAVVGISLYPGEYAFPWETISVAIFLSILPPLILTFVFQRYIVGGLTAGISK